MRRWRARNAIRSTEKARVHHAARRRGSMAAFSCKRSLLTVASAAALAAMLLFSNASISAAQQPDEARELNKKVIELYKAGRYADAIPIAQRILAILESA